MTERNLPEISEGLLDAAALEQLLRDVDACTELIEVMIKGGHRQRAAGSTADLAAVRTALLSGDCRGAQLRYRYQGAEWWDTVLPVLGGFKVVRIRPDWNQQ